MGATLLNRARNERCLVLTVFTENSETQTRQNENEAALSGLENIEVRNLGFDDAPIRNKAYRSGRGLLFNHQPEFKETVGKLERELLAIVGRESVSDIYAPLAVGEHVDHLIVFEAAMSLAASEHLKLWFYLDQPYAEIPFALDTRLNWLKHGQRNWPTISQSFFSKESFLSRLLSREQRDELSQIQTAARFDQKRDISLERASVKPSREVISEIRTRIKHYKSQEVFWPTWVNNPEVEFDEQIFRIKNSDS